MSDKTRREFLKSCFQIGGYAAIASLGLGAVEDARGWGILPTIIGGGSPNWATWNETDEGAIATDNIFVVLMENTSAGGNETGQGGGLSEADRTLTQTGSIAGAVGSPLTRQFDTNKWMTITNNLANFICESTYTIIMKWNTISDVDGEGTMLRITEAYNDTIITIGISPARQPYINTDSTSTDKPANTPLTTGDVYIIAQADNSHNLMFGWNVTKPTRWSDVISAQKVDTGGLGDLSGETAGVGTHHIGTALPSNNAALQITAKLQYIILANTTLLAY